MQQILQLVRFAAFSSVISRVNLWVRPPLSLRGQDVFTTYSIVCRFRVSCALHRYYQSRLLIQIEKSAKMAIQSVTVPTPGPGEQNGRGGKAPDSEMPVYGPMTMKGGRLICLQHSPKPCLCLETTYEILTKYGSSSKSENSRNGFWSSSDDEAVPVRQNLKQSVGCIGAIPDIDLSNTKFGPVMTRGTGLTFAKKFRPPQHPRPWFKLQPKVEGSIRRQVN